MAASSSELPCATARNAPAPSLRNFLISNSACFQPYCCASLPTLARYQAGVSSLGGSTVRARHKRLPSACAFSGAKVSLSTRPNNFIACKDFRLCLCLSLLLCSGNSVPLIHAPYTANSAACLRCVGSPKTAMAILVGFSSRSHCMALRTWVWITKASLVKSSIAHTVSAPLAALAQTGVSIRSPTFKLRRDSTDPSNSRCGKS